MSGQHCENYDVKRETVHCYPRNVDRCGWNLSALFKIYFCFVLLYNKSLNDLSLGEQWILFPSNLNVSLDFVSGNIEILGKQNSLFPSGPVIKGNLHSYQRFARVKWGNTNNLRLQRYGGWHKSYTETQSLRAEFSSLEWQPKFQSFHSDDAVCRKPCSVGDWLLLVHPTNQNH